MFISYWTLLRPALRARLDPRRPQRLFEAAHRPHLERARGFSGYVNAALALECQLFLKGLLSLEDRLSMSCGVELRAPFLDDEVFGFAQRIPVAYKLGPLPEAGGRSAAGKLILRRLLRGVLPPDTLAADKQGFSPPDQAWLRARAPWLRRELLGPDARAPEVLDPDLIYRAVEAHAEGRADHRLLLWSCLTLEWWLRLFIHGHAEAPPRLAPTPPTMTRYPLRQGEP